jgi:hypothetical protein
MLPAARTAGSGATLTTLCLLFATAAALGLPEATHACAIVPIGYPPGKFEPAGRAPLEDMLLSVRLGEAWQEPRHLSARHAPGRATDRH